MTDYRLAFERENKRAVKLAADLQAERLALYAERQEHARFVRLLAACGWVRDTPTGHPNQTTDGWLDEAGGKGGLCTSTESACAEAAARVAASGEVRELVRLRETFAQLDVHRDSLIREVMDVRGWLRDAIQRAEAAEQDREKLIGEGSASEGAFDAIATLCGCPEWEYPGQIVRDAEALKQRSDRLARENADLRAAMATLADHQNGTEKAPGVPKVASEAVRAQRNT